MKKNIFIIILIIIVFSGLIFAFYWFYLKPALKLDEEESSFQQEEKTMISAEESNLPSSLTPSSEIKQMPPLRNLISEDILAFWESGTSSIQYLTKEGLFEFNYLEEQIKKEKKEIGVNFKNILSIQPSNKDKILIKYFAEGATKPTFSILDINSREVKNLDFYIKNATWSPDGEKILYYYSDSPFYYEENFKESSYLAQLDKNLANRKILMNFKAASDIELLWATTSKVFITQKPSGIVETNVLVFDLDKKIFSPFVSGYGLILKWDNEGKYGLLFTTNNSGINPQLQLINKDGYILADFPKITLPEKCVFAHFKPLLYCSIFVNPIFSNVWPDIYYMGAISFDEMLYEVNLETTEVRLLDKTPFKINDIKISKDDSYLFFYDEKSNSLYSLKLSPEKSLEMPSSNILPTGTSTSTSP